jgi:uncharacterized protein YggE
MKRILITLCFLGCLLGAGTGRADETTIEVTSQGAVEVVPDMMWIEGRLSGSGDVKEAKKIIDGLKDDIRKVLEEPSFADIKVEYSKRSVTAGAGSPADMQRQFMEMMGEGGMPTEADAAFTLSESFRLAIKGVTDENFSAETERMIQLAEALTEKQIKLGQMANPMMSYYDGQNMGQFMRVGLSNPAEVWKTASRAAFEDAQSKATTLAEIVGGKLGSAVSVSVDTNEAGNDDMQQGLQELIVAQSIGMVSSARSGVSQGQLDRIPVKVSLRVRFSFSPAK